MALKWYKHDSKKVMRRDYEFTAKTLESKDTVVHISG